jgi:hypothetical protein
VIRLLLLLALQGSGWIVSPAHPTVGDTVTLSLRIPADPSATVLLEPLVPTTVLQPLATPRWSYAEGEITVVYRVAFFRAHAPSVRMPAVDVTAPDGSVVTVPPATVAVPVVSVLPDVPPDRIRPMASMGPLARQPTRLAPVIVLPAMVILGTLLIILWRRRPPAAPEVPVVIYSEVQVPLDEWIAAGESRAAATIVALKLRRIIAGILRSTTRYEDTDAYAAAILENARTREAETLVAAMRALDRARFSPAAPADIHEVIDEAERAVREFEAARAEDA